MIRAAVCGFVLFKILITNFSDVGRMPVTVLRPTGAMQLFPWAFYERLMTPTGMTVLKVLLVASLLAATAGFFTTVSTKFAALLFLFYEGFLRSFHLFNHDEMPMVYILVVLAFTPCGDSFSLDSSLRGVQSRIGKIVYGYPILLMRMLVAWSYFTSVLIKLRVAGFSYISPDTLPSLAVFHSLDNLHPTQFRWAFWLPQARGLTFVALMIVMLWEFTFPLAIFFRKARWIILGFGLIFHLSTIFFMNIFFPYHLAAYAVFVDWPRVWAWLPERFSRGRLFTVQALKP
jgi:hypothetical protein